MKRRWETRSSTSKSQRWPASNQEGLRQHLSKSFIVCEGCACLRCVFLSLACRGMAWEAGKRGAEQRILARARIYFEHAPFLHNTCSGLCL